MVKTLCSQCRGMSSVSEIPHAVWRSQKDKRVNRKKRWNVFQVEERENVQRLRLLKTQRRPEQLKCRELERVCHEVSLARLSGHLAFVSQELWKTHDYDMTGFTSWKGLLDVSVENELILSKMWQRGSTSFHISGYLLSQYSLLKRLYSLFTELS